MSAWGDAAENMLDRIDELRNIVRDYEEELEMLRTMVRLQDAELQELREFRRSVEERGL